MQTRRDVVRSLAWLAAGLGAAPLLAASGRADGAGTDTALDQLGFTLVSSDVPRDAAVAAAVPDGVACVQALTGDLYRRLAAAAGNVVVSPYSVAVALAMTRYGAAGTTASEMDAVLHAPSLPRLGAGMNSLSQLLGGRAGERTRPDRTKGMISLQIANSLWGQRDMTCPDLGGPGLPLCAVAPPAGLPPTPGRRHRRSAAGPLGPGPLVGGRERPASRAALDPVQKFITEVGARQLEPDIRCPTFDAGHCRCRTLDRGSGSLDEPGQPREGCRALVGDRRGR
jgi:hypothetical protein